MTVITIERPKKYALNETKAVNEVKSEPKIVIVDGVDRVGKGTFMAEIDKQTKYKHMTMDRGPASFQAYCDIFKKGDFLKEQYSEIERSLSLNPHVLVIYIDCDTEELVKRCVDTDHEILDFDFHKSYMDFYFSTSPYQNKIRVNSTNKHVSQIVKELIEGGVL